MSIFDKKETFIRSPLDGSILDRIMHKEPKVSFADKVNMVFTDVETEGKKQGYNRAAKEYDSVYQKLETEYFEAIRIISQQKNVYGNQADELINKLASLEAEEQKLKRQVEAKTNEVSKKYSIPVSTVRRSVSAGTLIFGDSSLTSDILDIVYRYKAKKLKDAEQRGYQEAKELYEKKLADLKSKYAELWKRGNRELQELISTIGDALDSIAEEQTKIAELRILLKEETHDK